MWQPVTLLTLILCSELIHPVLGFPFARQALVKSARSDDLISGSDFLSLFIGASLPRSRSRSEDRDRNYNKVSKLPDSFTSEESFTSSSYADDVSESSSFRAEPKDNETLPSSETPVDSSSVVPDPVAEGERNVVAAGSAASDEVDQQEDEDRKLLVPNESLNVVNAQDEELESTVDSDITSDKRVKYLSKSSYENIADGEEVVDRNVDKEIDTISFTTISNVDTFDKTSDIIPESEGASTSSLLNIDLSTDIEASASNVTETIREYSDLELLIDKSSDESKKLSEYENSPELSSKSEDDSEPTKSADNQTPQVLSVRVSSSVALVPSKKYTKTDESKNVLNTFLEPYSENNEDVHVPMPESASLVTEEEPAATAIQRSQFSVEEASPSSIISVHHESSSRRVFRPTSSIESPINPQSSPVSYQTSVSTATSGSRVQFYSEPPSYHRSVSSVAETIQRAVVAPQEQQPHRYGQVSNVFQNVRPLPVNDNQQHSDSSYDASQQVQSNYQTSSPQRSYNFHHHVHINHNSAQGQQPYQGDTSRAQKSYGRHQEPLEKNYEVPEQNYGTPERSYASPEKNYEVDETVSVMTNGRVHGIQIPPATTPGQTAQSALRDFNAPPDAPARDPNSKFGYVVEGRNYRKYQVEERTPDGFIVGEYGVVSHEDGSVNGVRYTADGTINPRVIYDALVKFLSL